MFSRHIVSNEVKGVDVEEESLSRVPRATNSDLLDGRDSPAFDEARMISGFVPAGAPPTQVAALNNAWQVVFVCPSSPGFTNGSVRFVNKAGAAMNVWIDTGSSNPTYNLLSADGQTASQSANRTGESITFSWDASASKFGTVTVLSHQNTQCLVKTHSSVNL